MQHAQDFVALLQLQLAYLIVPFHHSDRLDKKRRSGGGLVVHDGFDASLEFRAQRQHIPASALGDDGFLQHARAVPVVNIAGEPVHQARVADLHFRADAAKRFGGAVQHFAALRDGARYQVHQPQSVRQSFRELRHARGVFAVVLQNPAGCARDDQGGADCEQVKCFERHAAQGQVDQRAHIHRAAKVQFVGNREQITRFARQFLHGQRFFQIAGRTQRVRQGFRRAERGIRL